VKGARAEIHELMMRLAAGDRSAISPAFDALWPILCAFSARALGGEADAKDAAQQAVIKVFAQCADFDSARDGLAWALTIASFECRTIHRKNRRKREVSAIPTIVANETPEEIAIERDLERAAREILPELDERDREILVAAISDSRPSGATFRKRLQRAIARLRIAWRAKHEAK